MFHAGHWDWGGVIPDPCADGVEGSDWFVGDEAA